tara:strand:- start:191 stop:2995 length:2805 start_codon:yes stop_codon:yes gene_type:complete
MNNQHGGSSFSSGFSSPFRTLTEEERNQRNRERDQRDEQKKKDREERAERKEQKKRKKQENRQRVRNEKVERKREKQEDRERVKEEKHQTKKRKQEDKLKRKTQKLENRSRQREENREHRQQVRDERRQAREEKRAKRREKKAARLLKKKLKREARQKRRKERNERLKARMGRFYPKTIDLKKPSTSIAKILVNSILYSLYSLAGSLIYYPSMLINMPDSTLERTLPKSDLCKSMGLSERTCKKKIKCLVSNCSFLDDPVGYQLDRKTKPTCERKISSKELASQLGGKITRKRKKKIKPLPNWKKYIPDKVKGKLKTLYVLHVLNQNNNISRKNKKAKKGKTYKNKKKIKGGNACGGCGCCSSCNPQQAPPMNMNGNNSAPTKESKGENNNINKETCSNIKQKVLCYNRKTPKYNSSSMFKKCGKDLLKYNKRMQVLLSGLKVQKGGSNSESSDGAKQENNNVMNIDEKEMQEITSDFMINHLKPEHIFKLAISVRILEEIFANDENTNNTNNTANLEIDDVEVTFPWKTKDPNMCLSERLTCMKSHITRDSVDLNLPDEKKKEMYEKCFVCKNCTLRNTAKKAWGKLMNNIFVGNKTQQLIDAITIIYNMLQRDFVNFSYMTPKQYYLTTLLSLQMSEYSLNLDSLDCTFNINDINYPLKDLIVGIPKIEIIRSDNLNVIKPELKQNYNFLKGLNLHKNINNTYYRSVLKRFFEIDPTYNNERLHYLKNIAFNNYKLLYVKNNTNILINLYKNKINTSDMKQFALFRMNNNISNMLVTLLKDESKHQELSKLLKAILRNKYEYLLDKSNFDDSIDPDEEEQNIENDGIVKVIQNEFNSSAGSELKDKINEVIQSSTQSSAMQNMLSQKNPENMKDNEILSESDIQKCDKLIDEALELSLSNSEYDAIEEIKLFRTKEDVLDILYLKKKLDEKL